MKDKRLLLVLSASAFMWYLLQALTATTTTPHVSYFQALFPSVTTNTITSTNTAQQYTNHQLSNAPQSSDSQTESQQKGDIEEARRQPGQMLEVFSSSLDVLSVGSQARPEFQQAQRETFGSHRGVRNFYAATEADDTDQECHQELTPESVWKVSKFCHGSQQATSKYTVLSKLSKYFFEKHDLKHKTNPAGWLCAQKRPLDGFVHLIQKYNYTYQQDDDKEKSDDTTSNIPDYLVIMDDDTWVNLNQMLPILYTHYPSNEAHVVAGCLMITNPHDLNFTVPYGGYGIVLTREAIRNWLRPIHCESTDPTENQIPDPWSARDDWTKLVCWRLSHNGVGEQPYFRNGMNLMDLMHAYATSTKFHEAVKWWGVSPGFCFHSDWAWAYFMNYYPVAQLPRKREDFHFRPYRLFDRISGYNHSLFRIFEGVNDRQAMQQCANGIDAKISGRSLTNATNGDTFCSPNAHICHRISPSHMQRLHTWNQVSKPQHYFD